MGSARHAATLRYCSLLLRLSLMIFGGYRLFPSLSVSMGRSRLAALGVLGASRPTPFGSACPSWLCPSHAEPFSLLNRGDPAVFKHHLFSLEIREMIEGFQRNPRAQRGDEWELIEAASLAAPILSSTSKSQTSPCRALSMQPPPNHSLGAHPLLLSIVQEQAGEGRWHRVLRHQENHYKRPLKSYGKMCPFLVGFSSFPHDGRKKKPTQQANLHYSTPLGL